MCTKLKSQRPMAGEDARTIPYATVPVEGGEDDAPALRALHASMLKRRGGHLLHLDRMLLHSVPYATGWGAFFGAIRTQLALDPVLRELAICLVALLNAAPYEMRQHAPEFLAAGGTPAQLAVLAPMGLEVENSCGTGQARPRPVAPASLASLEAAYPALASVFSHSQRLCILLTMQMTWNVAVDRCGWGHVPVTPPTTHWNL
jgi:hypothetical protein